MELHCLISITLKVVSIRLLELVELMSTPNKKVTAGEMKPRQSGSMAWRMARGELGANAKSINSDSGGHVWKLTKEEENGEVFHLEYDVVSDKYTRHSVNDKNKVVHGWENGIKECQDVVRKEEKNNGYADLN